MAIIENTPDRLVETVWVVREQNDPDRYLEHTPGGWGPQHAFGELAAAIHFETAAEAIAYARQPGLGFDDVVAVELTITTEYKLGRTHTPLRKRW